MSSSASAKSTLETDTLFTEFFELGQEESVSPFLKPNSRQWSVHLTLKASLLASVFLILSFILSFWTMTIPLSHFLLVGVYFLAGIPSLIEAIEDLLNGVINIDILMTLAAFSSILIGSQMEGALLLVLFALSGAMEDAVTDKAKGAISKLHKLAPTRACVLEADGTLIERAIKDIDVSTKILVKAGQIVPLDGIVIEGTSSLNLVHLTGESMPVTKVVGDEVPAGGKNLDGALVINVTRKAQDSTLARIIQLVTEAQDAKPKLQRWFDSLSRAYAITIILLSACFALTLPFLLSIPFLGTEGSIYRALAFLIAASPCALIIAIPIAYLSAVSACARKGILIKGGVTLDALASCQAIAFDKTGTLTTGELACVGYEALLPQDNARLDEALSLASALERNALHPIAAAITKYAEAKQLKLPPLEDFKAIAGYGLQATYQKEQSNPKTVYIGRPSYIADKLPPQLRTLLLKRTEEIEELGELLAVLIVEESVFLFRFQDTLRRAIKETIEALQAQGLSTVMLTGDHYKNAKSIAQKLGLSEFHADLFPQDKLNYVSELTASKGLAMIGDGVNDAPALARATVGICMGKVGSHAAIEAADVVLLHDNIELLGWLMDKAKLTKHIVAQNLSLAAIAILVASLPALGGIIPLWLAVIMHEGGTVLVGLNALRLLRK